MRRRTFLGIAGAGTLPLAGCTTDTGSTDVDPTGTGSADADSTDTDGRDTPETGADTGPSDCGTTTRTDTPNPDTGTDVPDDCPTTQGLDLEWPEELDAATVEAFVEAYEHAYYRDVVVEYEPRSRLDSYELRGSVTDGPRVAGTGWTLAYSGSGGIYRPTLAMEATVAEAPGGADVVPADRVDDEALRELLDDAAETGDADFHVEPPGERVDRYVDLLASLSDDFERLSGRGDSDTLYVDVDGTTVELTATATNFHGDYWWETIPTPSVSSTRTTDGYWTSARNTNATGSKHLSGTSRPVRRFRISVSHTRWSSNVGPRRR